MLGATGHIGHAIVRELLARGWQVTAATRQIRPGILSALDVSVAPGDADRPGQIDAWARGHELVVDAAAPYPVQALVPETEAERDPFGYADRRTRALLEAVRRHGARLGYVSSFTTLPRAERGLSAMEARWRRRTHPYFEVKRRMEDAILVAARAGLPVAVVNPGASLGPWDTKPRERSLIALLLDGALPVVTSACLDVVDVRDVAIGLCGALEGGHFGEPIPLAGHHVSVADLAEQVCRLGGVAAPPWRAPTRVGLGAALWTEAAFALRGKPSPWSALSMLLLCDAVPVERGRVQRAIGLVARPLEETLRDAIAWHRRAEGRGA